MRVGWGWNTAVPWAALALGGLLGWAGGVWSGPRTAAPLLPLLDVAAGPPNRLSPPAAELPPALGQAASHPAASAATPAANSGHGVRAVIDRELPHATADEKEIWFEQLKELPPGIVEDLLNVRKQFRQMVPPLAPPLTPAPLALSPSMMTPPQAVDPIWQKQRESLEEIRQIARHNLANANTPGYRRIEPLLEAAGDWQGLHFTGTRLDLRPGPIRATNRLADVALDGIGWFAVEAGETLAVTRRGTFVVRNGRLALPIGGGQFSPLVPPIMVPEHVQRIDIASGGEVGGWTEGATTPQSLGFLKIALLSDAGQEALEAGQPIPRDAVSLHQPGAAGTAALVTRSLEQSNVIVEEERDRLRWIDECLEHFGAAMEGPVTEAHTSPIVPQR